MNQQKISPWTFLKQKVESQNYFAKLKGKPQLPRIVKKRQSASTQEKQSRQIIFKSKKCESRNVKTLIFLQGFQEFSSPIVNTPQKKKTEPVMSKDQEVEDEMQIKVDHLNYLNQIKLAAKFIYSSLEEEQKHQSNDYQSSKTIIQQIRKKNLSIPQIFTNSNQCSPRRIHDKNIELKMSAIRSILKREHEGIFQIKNNVSYDKKSNEITTFKLKLAENSLKIH